MEVVKLIPKLQKLNKADKLYVIQFLVSELAQQETDLLKPEVNYPVWSPYDSSEAAETMLQVLKNSELQNK